jgi:hypothetical protein
MYKCTNFYFLFFWGGWARPSQPGQVTGQVTNRKTGLPGLLETMKTTVMLLLSDWATLSKGPVSNFPSILLALLLWLLLTWCGEAGDERLTNACSFFALHLPFESKGIAGNVVLLLSPCFSIFSPLSVLFLLSVFPWVFFFRPLGLCYALPFIRPRELAPKPVLPLQDCYPSTNEIVGRERGHD